MLDKNYEIRIYPWMFKVDMTPCEREIYALILEETKRHSEFRMSISQTAKLLNVTQATVVRCFGRLVDKGLVEKRASIEGSAMVCFYKAKVEAGEAYD